MHKLVSFSQPQNGKDLLSLVVSSFGNMFKWWMILISFKYFPATTTVVTMANKSSVYLWLLLVKLFVICAIAVTIARIRIQSTFR